MNPWVDPTEKKIIKKENECLLMWAGPRSFVYIKRKKDETITVKHTCNTGFIDKINKDNKIQFIIPLPKLSNKTTSNLIWIKF